MSAEAAPAPMCIRAAREADAPALARLSEALGYPAEAEQMRRRVLLIGARTDHAVFVAQRAAGAGAPVLLGWIHVAGRFSMEAGESAEILGLVIAAEVRRQGVGRRLVAAAEQWSRAAGLPRIVVRSNDRRTEAHSFYPALDYHLAKMQRVYVKRLEG